MEEVVAMQERTGVVTFAGNPMTLIGPDLREGDAVPEFTLLTDELAPTTWRELQGKIILFNIVPSLDTGVCSVQTKRFNEELAKLPSSVTVITVSADLPFAQARFARAEQINHRILSDYRDFSFAHAFGVGIKELRLLTRAVFVADAMGKITYREIVPEITHHPKYEAALRAAKGLAGVS
jgi:thioredoxin-dependent peroxiredoxin